MEGYLSLWVGILIGWDPHYVVLKEDILTVLKDKGKEEVGRVSLKIAEIHCIPEDDLRIIINSGTKELHFKASTYSIKEKWLEALNKTKKELDSQSHQMNTQPATETNFFRSSTPINKSQNDLHISDFDRKIAALRTKQASLDQTAKALEPEMKKNPEMAHLVSKLVDLSRELEETVSECVQDFERESSRFSALMTEMQYIESPERDNCPTSVQKKHEAQDVKRNLVESFGNKQTFNPTEPQNYDVGAYETPFYSFYEEEDKEAEKRELEARAGSRRPIESKELFLRVYSQGEYPNTFNELEDYNLSLNHQTSELVADTKQKKDSFILQLHSAADSPQRVLHPLISKLLENNQAFKGVKLVEEIEREALPYLQDPNTNSSFKRLFELIRTFIRQHNPRISLPVWINEPLGLLQKLCESLEHYDILVKANQLQDSCLRLAYVCVFAVSSYANTINRTRKPFNPLLGETFEFLSPDGSFQFISEQISHHPPVSASYAEGPAFKIWAGYHDSMTIGVNSLDLRPKSYIHVVLPRNKDRIVYQRAILTVHNLFIGKRYVENHGDMIFRNEKTGEIAALHLNKRGWTNRGAYKLQGSIVGTDGKVRYIIEGKWDSKISVVDAATQKEVFQWQRPQPMKNYEKMYYFSRFSLQLNHLTPSMLQKIAPTDTRLRPDLRLLEIGKIEAANREKIRLEEKQRLVQKYYESMGKTHKPKWFKETISPATKEIYYEYLGGYWEARRNGAFGNSQDLYSDDTVSKLRV